MKPVRQARVPFPAMADERPFVLICGGLFTSPIVYRHMRRRLLDRGAERVHVAPIWTPDWLLAGAVGFGPLLRRTGITIARAHREARGRPLLVIGHSAGGLLARLAMSPQPYRRRVAAVADAVGALVTLGTPHRLVPGWRSAAGYDAASFLEATTPGAFFAPRTGYLTVASRYVLGSRRWRGGLRRTWAGESYASMLGEEARLDWGDGLIPASAAHLEGARQITLEGIAHGQAIAPWYGDEPGLEGWWPDALDVWREALTVRRGGAVADGPVVELAAEPSEPVPEPPMHAARTGTDHAARGV
jgi:hypothetical protein